MAQISIEYGKKRTNGSVAVSLIVVSGKTKKRIKTGIELGVDDYKIYPDGRVRITNNSLYFQVEDVFADYKRRLMSIQRDYMGISLTAEEIYLMMTRKNLKDIKNMNFFEYADSYIERSSLKGKKNYRTMLNSLQRYNNGIRVLPFYYITFSFLQGYSLSLKGKQRAQSLYLGAIRHIYKQACLEYNTETETVLSPMLFDRFKVPKQKMIGQRALDVDTIRKFFEYTPKTKRQTLAQDACMLSVCLMGTNSVDLYNATY